MPTDRVSGGTPSDSLSSEMTVIHNEQQRYKFGSRGLENNVTGDKLNSMSKPWSAHNYEPAHQTTNFSTGHINISPGGSLSSYQAVALSNSSQDDVNYVRIGPSLGNRISNNKNIDDKVVNFSQVGKYINYSDTSKRVQANNTNYNEYMLAEHKTLDSSVISGRVVTLEDLRGTENETKHMTPRHNTREETETEVENSKHGLNYKSTTNEDNVTRETENTYNAASYVSQKPTQDNADIIKRSDAVAFDQEDQLYMSAQGEEEDVFPRKYKTEAQPQISSYETLRALRMPSSPPSRPAGSTHRSPGNRHIPLRPYHAYEDTDSHGSATSYYSLSSDSPYKSQSTSYRSKPRDSFGSASASFSSTASRPYRSPTVSYISSPQKLPSFTHSSQFRKPPSTPHSSPSQKPPSVLYGSLPRKPPRVSYESPPYKQMSTSHNSPSIDLHGSPNTLHYSPLSSPSYGSTPQKTSRPSFDTQPSDLHGSLTSPYSSSPHGSRPPGIIESLSSHGPSRPSYSSPPKKSSGPSYNLQFSALPYSASTEDSWPPVSENSPSHKSHRPSYGSSQKPPNPSQSSELYKSPTSPHYSRPPTSDSSTHGSHKPSHGSSSQKSLGPSYESQPSELYEVPTSPYGSSAHDSKPPRASDGSHRISYGSTPETSHRLSYDSESTDSYKSPSSSYSSAAHGSRSSSISGSSPLPKPIYNSSSRDSSSMSYGLPSTIIHEAPSSTFHESLSSSEGGTVGLTQTYVKTDHHGNFKWGVRHSVDNQYAGSHH